MSQFHKTIMDCNNSHSPINIIQWNAQSIRPKRLEIESLLHQEKIHLALISETWLDPNINFHISGYNIFRTDRADGFGGVAILTHKSVELRNAMFNYQTHALR
jgi:exonuclease III